MNICLSCGAVFDDNEAEYKRHSGTYDRDGGCIDPPSSEELCPECGSDDFTEATECMICGEWFEENLHHVCAKCLNKYATTENAIEFCADEDGKVKVEINGFLATVFSSDEIDEILKKEYLEAVRLSGDRQAEMDYCGDSIRDDSFADFICDKLKEEK